LLKSFNMSSSNNKDVFSTVHDDVAAVADSTADDSDNSGGVKGHVVPEMKGNDNVAVAISRIFKYKKEHGNVAVPSREPHTQLRRWIVHAKATSKTSIAQGSGNPKFTLPN
jgi:hypothetical protein